MPGKEKMRRFVVRRACAALAGLALAAPAAAQAPQRPLVHAIRQVDDVALSWSADPLATSYEVERTLDLAQPFQNVATTPSPSFLDLGAVTGFATAFYQVIAIGPGGSSAASNLAFKIDLDIQPRCTGCSYPFFSLPYLYFPGGTIGAPPTTDDLCGLDPSILRVLEMKDECGIYRLLPCSLPISTPLQAGRAYGFDVMQPVLLPVVGSHDPEFEPGGARSVPLRDCTACVGPGELALSIPYHARARSAAALCAELNASGKRVSMIDDLQVLGRGLHVCGTALPDLPLVMGRGYRLTVLGDAAYQPEVQ